MLSTLRLKRLVDYWFETYPCNSQNSGDVGRLILMKENSFLKDACLTYGRGQDFFDS